MSKREDYKRFIVFCLASLVVLAQMGVFAYVWYNFYRGQIDEPFWRKGNWVLIAIYGLMFALFAKLYGGLKVGYLKRIDVFYSLVLALLCTNVVEYFEITLINRWFLSVGPMLEMTAVQLVLIIIWIWGSRYIYSKLYRARKLLVIYGDRDPGDDLIHKMNSRKDKYEISGKVHSSVGEKEVHKMMREYDGVIIWDLPSAERNRYLKHCFAHSIRCYVSPKISDIILMGSDRIHLFDTPLLMSRNMGLSVDQRVAKRILDIVVSGIGLILTSPIMLIIAIAVKAYDKGPVFYYQDRLTLMGRPFKSVNSAVCVWILRKMAPDWHPKMIPASHRSEKCSEIFIWMNCRSYLMYLREICLWLVRVRSERRSCMSMRKSFRNFITA